MIAATLFDPHLPGQNFVYQESGLFVIAGRIVWASLQWMGQLYLLTDRRIVRVCGVFSKDIAATKVELVLAAARRYGHPLQCIMEAA